MGALYHVCYVKCFATVLLTIKSVYDIVLINIECAIKNRQSREIGKIGTQDEQQSNITTGYVLDTTMRKQTQFT